MKRLIAATLLLVSSTCLAWKITDERMLEYDKIVGNPEELTTYQEHRILPALLTCHRRGNKLCGSLASAIYQEFKDYPNAYKYAEETKGIMIRNGARAAFSNETLGDLYFNGLGVIQDYDKAIENYKVCAFVGNKNCAFGLGLSLRRKGQSSLDSIAWSYVAVSLGYENIKMLSNGKVYLLADYLVLEESKHTPQFNGAVKARANKLCSTIPGCVK